MRSDLLHTAVLLLKNLVGIVNGTQSGAQSRSAYMRLGQGCFCRLIAALIPRSNSTAVSFGHSCLCSSSRVSRWPSRSIKASKSRKDSSGRRMVSPWECNSPVLRSSSKTPKRARAKAGCFTARKTTVPKSLLPITLGWLDALGHAELHSRLVLGAMLTRFIYLG